MSKDWTGNKKSVFATLGASSHSKQERETNDFYATDPVAIDRLASKFDIPHKVWECACGKGHLSDRLKSLGHDVYSTDIIDRGYSQFDGVLDFLNPLFYPHENDRCVLTNPPFKFLSEFVLNALEWLPEGGYACFFLKTTAIESRGRYERIFKNCPPPSISSSSSTGFCVRRMGNLRMRERTLAQVHRHTHGLYGVKGTRVSRN